MNLKLYLSKQYLSKHISKRIFRSTAKTTAKKRVRIPNSLIEKLKPYGKRFLKVQTPVLGNRESGKRAIEEGWLENLYDANDPSLQEWLDRGGNYGIAFGKAIIGIDLDIEDLVDKFHVKVNTFETQSGSSRGNHAIIISDINENGSINRFNPTKVNPRTGEVGMTENIGTIQCNRKLLVGPNSNHFSGGVYRIINDVPIAYVTKEQIDEIFGEELTWTSKRLKDAENEANKDKSLLKSLLGAEIPIQKFVSNFDTFKPLSPEGEWQGSHPIHGSTGGHNFDVNTKKNVWYCHRCNTGGGIVSWIAVVNRLIDCADAQHGAITGELFKKVKAILRKAGYELETTDDEKLSRIDRLINLALEQKIELFYDQHKVPYARVPMPWSDDVADDVASAEQNTDNDLDAKTLLERRSTSLRFLEKKEEEGYKDTKIQSEPSIPSKPSNRPMLRPMLRPLRPMLSLQLSLQIMPLSSSRFKNWLSWLAWTQERRGVGTDAIKSAVGVLSGKALNEGRQYTLYNRVAVTYESGTYESGKMVFWLDMADHNNRAIRLTGDSIDLIDNPPILFRRYAHQQALSTPDLSAKVEGRLQDAVEDAWRMLDYINIDKEDKSTRLMLICTIISYFIPDIAHPAIVASGPQGSCKTWLFRLIRRVIDPSSIELLSLPTDAQELARQLEHHWVAAYDNLTTLSSWASEMICRAVTGGGMDKRKLYTDDEDTILNFKRCVSLNGINPAAQKGDLLDRSLLVMLSAIPKQNRRLEADLLADFSKDLPKILGGFLVVLSKAMQLYPTIKLKEYQRLADFHRWACAISIALGSTAEALTDAYAEKVSQQNEEAVNSDNVALILIRFVEQEVKGHSVVTIDGTMRDCWYGEPTDLYNRFKEHASALGMDAKSKNFPKAPHALTRRLNIASPSLHSIGIEVSTTKSGRRKILIDATHFKVEAPVNTLTDNELHNELQEMQARKWAPNEVEKIDEKKEG